jgi:hypothetical protein
MKKYMNVRPRQRNVEKANPEVAARKADSAEAPTVTITELMK